MKILYRTLIIIAVALIASLGIFWLGQNLSAISNLISPSEIDSERTEPSAEEFAEGQLPRGGGQGNRPEGGRGEHGEGRGEQNHHDEASLVDGVKDVAKALIKIGIITVAVLAAQFSFRKLQDFRKTKTVV